MLEISLEWGSASVFLAVLVSITVGAVALILLAPRLAEANVDLWREKGLDEPTVGRESAERVHRMPTRGVAVGAIVGAWVAASPAYMAPHQPWLPMQIGLFIVCVSLIHLARYRTAHRRTLQLGNPPSRVELLSEPLIRAQRMWLLALGMVAASGLGWLLIDGVSAGFLLVGAAVGAGVRYGMRALTKSALNWATVFAREKADKPWDVKTRSEMVNLQSILALWGSLFIMGGFVALGAQWTLQDGRNWAPLVLTAGLPLAAGVVLAALALPSLSRRTEELARHYQAMH